MENGQGKLVKKNGDRFEGTFKDGNVDGEVIIHYADGSRFRGVYQKGKRNGKAIEEDSDGLRFEGTYVDDRRDGEFVEKDRNGQIIKKGTYQKGIRNEDK